MNNEQMIKIKNFDYLNQNTLKGKILFTGSSLMEQFPICEIARDADVMTAAFKEYTGQTLNKDKKSSVRKKLQQAITKSLAKHT